MGETLVGMVWCDSPFDDERGSICGCGKIGRIFGTLSKGDSEDGWEKFVAASEFDK